VSNLHPTKILFIDPVVHLVATWLIIPMVRYPHVLTPFSDSGDVTDGDVNWVMLNAGQFQKEDMYVFYCFLSLFLIHGEQEGHFFAKMCNAE
jgi:hypothetical protein